MKRVMVLLLMILMVRLSGYAQGIVKPPGGKAIIHFVFDKSIPSGATLLFMGHSMIGEFLNDEHTHIVAEPGHHVFWVRNMETAWMEAYLAADKIYLVVIDGSPGNAPAIRLIPVKDGSPRFWELTQTLRERHSTNTSRKRLPEDEQLDHLISTSIAGYRNGDVPASRISILSADMDIGNISFEVPPVSH